MSDGPLGNRTRHSCCRRSIHWCVLLSTFRGEQDLIKEAFSLVANTLPLREIDGLSAQTTLRAL